jgi:hypothetical protein
MGEKTVEKTRDFPGMEEAIRRSLRTGGEDSQEIDVVESSQETEDALASKESLMIGHRQPPGWKPGLARVKVMFGPGWNETKGNSSGGNQPRKKLHLRKSSSGTSYRPAQIRPGQVRSNQIRSDHIRSDQIRSDQISSGQTRPDQIRSDQTRPDQIRADEIRSDQIR